MKPLLVSLFLFSSFVGWANPVDITNARIYTTITDKQVLRRSMEVLQQEVKKRTKVSWNVVEKLPNDDASLVVIALEKDVATLPVAWREEVRTLPAISAEGYKLVVIPASSSVLMVAKDARGVLYGIGRLLRKMEMSPQKITIDAATRLATSPRYPVRGHQLGYRPKTNAYDAFSVAQFDQYIRELAIFGANSIELVPPRTDDDVKSGHMKLPAMEMIREQSRICQEYGLDVWMWYPNMGTNYTHPDSIKLELDERHKVFSAIPKLNHVFVPGGDPGDLEPDIMFAWLDKMSVVLKKYHPNAKIWVSPQVFKPSQKWFNSFFAQVNRGYPWFGGVVFGPWVKMPVQEIRRLTKASIPIRHYPDITHNYSSQYPVPHWDLAFAQTLGRESINPRPHDEKTIHNALDEYGTGSISYSEGTNDDVNKFVWSDQDWNPVTPVIETLRDYARFFVGTNYQESVAQGLVALENTFRGPLLTNESVERTLMQWQTMEQQAPLAVLQNPRFQMGLIRSYYDAYTRRRLLYEIELEQQAKDALRGAGNGKSLAAIQQAKLILERAVKAPILPEYRQKCFDLADSLFKSIGAQLTVERHGAVSGRGNFVDNIDLPLNDSPWLLDEMGKIEQLTSEAERQQKIEQLLHRTDPGVGGFYDHFGAPESWHRVISELPWEKDPGSLQSPRVSFGVGIVGEDWVDEIKATGFKGQVTPRAWMKQVKTLYEEPLKIAYNELDSKATYRMRVSYTGRFRSRMKLVTDDGAVIHDFFQTGEEPLFEFDIPQKSTVDGKVTFIWTCGEGGQGPQVTEIWLMKK